MNANLISSGTRVDFREALTSFTLQQIRDIFAAGEFEPNLQHQPTVSGERRTLVEQYFANIDLANQKHIKRLLAVFEELIFRLGKASDWDAIQAQQVTINNLESRMMRDGFSFENGRFVSSSLTAHVLETPSIIALTAKSIAEHIEKARTKIAEKDCAGAITNAYTLVEEFLKEILRQTGTSFKENEGDIRSLYNSVSDTLNLNPKGENLEGHLRTILQGLKSVIAGLYDVANKASDRHARKYNPAEHHAKLAVNAALAVCEFILDSYEYQRQMSGRKANA